MKTARNAIRLLRQFTIDQPVIGVTELARKLDLDKSTVHRLLQSLAAEGVVERDPDSKRYRLGIGILDLAAAQLAQVDIVNVAAPYMDQLRADTGETIALVVHRGYEVMCVSVLEGVHLTRVSYYVGQRAPIHCTASGFVFLANMPPDECESAVARSIAQYPSIPPLTRAQFDAHLARVAREGCAVDNEFYFDGLRAASAPIRNRKGLIECCLVVAAPSQRISLDALWDRARQVKDVAEAAGRNLSQSGHTRRPSVRIGLTNPN